MTTTTTADLIVPEVYADLAAEKLAGKVRVLPHALQDDSLTAQPGDRIKFPKWNALGELEDLTEGVPMVPERMTQSDSEAVVKEAGKAVEFTDSADLYGLGSPGDNAREQFAERAARKIDGDLITAAVAPGAFEATLASGTAITWAEVVAGIGEFGDEWEPDEFSGLFIRSTLHTAIMTDDQFLAAHNSALGNDIVRRGLVGVIGGVPVYLTNRLPAEAPAALIKKGSLGCFYKRRPVVETDRDILARTTVVATNVHYAVKRLNDAGVVAFRAA